MWQKVDKYTLQTVTQHPSPVYHALQTNLEAESPYDSIESKKHATADDKYAHAWMEQSGDKAGHGPYIMESHTPGQQTVFRAFKDFHRGTPKVDKVIHREIDSSSTRASLLKAGQVHVVRDLLPTEFKELEKTSGVTVDNFSGPGRSLLLFLMMNNTKAPFNNKLVRQALAHAAPYGEIVQDVYLGYASQWKGVISRDYPHFDESVWPYGDGDNIAKAKSLLSEAGYGGGFQAEIIYNGAEAVNELLAVKLQTAFDRIGVHLNLSKMAAAAFTDKLTNKNFDTGLWLDLALTPDIGYACYLFYRSTGFSNFEQYNSPQADALIDKILTTLDENQRAVVAKQFQALMLDDSPLLFLAQPHFVVARRSNVTGITAYTGRALRFDDLDIT
jgi:peptide/nickel transport system substrate-binding protein